MLASRACRSFRRLALGLLCSLALTSAAPPALAQETAEDRDELKRLRSLFQQAVELERAGNWSGALQVFREVGQSKMTPQVRYHIALCEEKLGRLVAALGGYEFALAEAESVGPDFRTEVEGSIQALRQRIPMLTIERGPGAGAATIAVDGVALGATSIGQAFPVDPGPHAVSAKSPGYKDFVGVVELGDAEQRTFVIELELREPPPTSRVPDAALVPPFGEQQPRRSRLVPYIVGGVGGAALLTSGVLFFMRQDSLSDLEGRCQDGSCPKDSEEEYDKLTTYHYGAQIALGVGVAALGTAAALILLEPKQKPQTTGVHVVPQVSSEAAGLHFLGAF